jgi:hypothetical protein
MIELFERQRMAALEELEYAQRLAARKARKK